MATLRQPKRARTSRGEPNRESGFFNPSAFCIRRTSHNNGPDAIALEWDVVSLVIDATTLRH